MTLGEFVDLPAADPEVVEFMGGESLQGRDGLVDGLPTSVLGDEFIEQHGRYSFIDACFYAGQIVRIKFAAGT